MKIATIDAKRRIILPQAEAGEAFAIDQPEPGHYTLTKVVPAPRKTSRSAREIDAGLATAALTPKTTWDQLKSLTREP